MRVFMILAIAIAVPQVAAAADWRYCLAPSHAERKIYMTPPFVSPLAMDEAESQFAQTLNRSGVHYDDVQCPRSDDQASMQGMEQHALDINRQLGNQIVTIRWKPAGS